MSAPTARDIGCRIVQRTRESGSEMDTLSMMVFVNAAADPEEKSRRIWDELSNEHWVWKVFRRHIEVGLTEEEQKRVHPAVLIWMMQQIVKPGIAPLWFSVVKYMLDAYPHVQRFDLTHIGHEIFPLKVPTTEIMDEIYQWVKQESRAVDTPA